LKSRTSIFGCASSPATDSVGRRDEAIDDQGAGLVGVKDVVLQVQRALGELDQDGAGHERIEAGRQQSKCRVRACTVGRDARRDPALKTCHAGTFSS